MFKDANNSNKLKIESTHEPAVPLENIYMAKGKEINRLKTSICTPMFVATLLTITLKMETT